MLLDRRRFAAGAAAVAAAPMLAGEVRAQSPSGKLVLYTSQPDRDAQQTVNGFRAAHPGVEVEIFRSGTTEVMAKLGAEFAGGQPRPDVLLIADAVSMELLKAENRLERHETRLVEGLSPASFDPDLTYFGTKLITTGIIYNRAAKLQPTSWMDLARPELKGQISMASPLYSGAAAIKLGAVVARPDLGWRFVEALKANEASAVRGNGAVLRAVATGEKAFGIIVDFMAYNARAQGSPVEFVFPREGVTAVTEPVAMLKTAANKPAARAFIDYILSEPGQRLALSQGYLPARSSVGQPAWLPQGAEVKIMEFDMKKLMATTEADKKRFADLFGA